MELKPGARLVSNACDTEVIVVKSPGGDVDLRCGGAPMALKGGAAEPAELDGALSEGAQIGKRYSEGGLELLCTKAGAGTLSLGSTPIAMKDAKPLPSSD